MIHTIYTSSEFKGHHLIRHGPCGRKRGSRRPVTLVYWEDCETKAQAMSREWHIKRLTRAEKLSLIAESLPLEGKVARPVSRKGRDG